MTRAFQTACVLGVAGSLGLLGQAVVKQQGYVPFSDAPISYRGELLDDPIARLDKQLESGRVKLQYDPKHGYLPAVLQALHVPASSQTLVFSKTSFQYPNISPDKPRALYFNDDVYVGRVQQGKLLEFVSFDPLQGAIFYVMDEHESARPRFERAIVDCVQCHVGPSTRGVPGVMLRSVYTRPNGTQAGGTPASITGHESPLQDRWGGWYVTGILQTKGHLGNSLLRAGITPETFDRSEHATLASLEGVLDTSWYLTGTSDAVAHLVLAHQTQMHNLITLTNYQTRLALDAKQKRGLSDEALQARIERPAEQLVKYLLFANEAPLEATVDRNSAFARDFAERGPRDATGRSLREFDLRRRIFKFPCSYLIYSEDFDAIPEPAKSFILHRLFSVLTGADTSEAFRSLTQEDRRAVLEILADTKPNLPEEWRQFAKRGVRREEALPAMSKIQFQATDRNASFWKEGHASAATEPIRREGVWNDEGTAGKSWAASDNGYGVSWLQAQRYCETLEIEGRRGWRLPEIGELQALVSGSANAAGYRIRGPLKLTGWAWSATPGQEPGEGMALDFGDGGRASVVAGDSGLNRALCVSSRQAPVPDRSADPDFIPTRRKNGSDHR